MICYILCGMPGSGKSHWRTNFKDQCDWAYVISTDDHVERYANTMGLPYSDAWAIVKDTLDNILHQQVEEVKRTNQRIVIWDQTNLSLSKRNRIRSLLGPKYEYLVVDFTQVPMHNILEVNSLRKESGRDLPHNVLTHFKDMCDRNVFGDHEIVLPYGKVSELITLSNGGEIHD